MAVPVRPTKQRMFTMGTDDDLEALAVLPSVVACVGETEADWRAGLSEVAIGLLDPSHLIEGIEANGR